MGPPMIVALSRVAAFTGAFILFAFGMLYTNTHSDVIWLLMLLFSGALLLYAILPRMHDSVPHVNSTIVSIGAVCIVGFLLMTIQLVRIQIVEADEISQRSMTVADGSVVQDPRNRTRDSDVARGRIFTRDQELVANTVESRPGYFERTYPNQHLAALAGYHSPALFGNTLLESVYDETLMGREGGNPFNEWLDQVLHRTRHGYDIQLTVDSELQRLGYDLLGDRDGAIVVMDAETGAIYSMVSKPHIDPSRLYAGFGPEMNQQISSASEYWLEVTESEGSPLLFRPTQGLYAPGSVFKTITAASVLENGLAEPSTVFRNEGALVVGSHVIEEQNLPEDGRVSFTLTESYGYSLNVVFADLGIRLGRQRLTETAQQFGFESTIPFDFPVTESRIYSSPEYLDGDIGLAETAFGQGQLFATPLQIAIMTQAVVNDGEMTEPFLMHLIRDNEGGILSETSPSSWKEAIDPDIAAELQEIMIESVQSGWATDAQISGAVVGGKTGTAEVGDRTPHAWYTGFAGQDEPRFVISVVVEHGGGGGAVALPIAREMLIMAMDRID
jgi:penicillin-binding protein A